MFHHSQHLELIYTGTFFLYAGTSFVGFVTLYFLLPETKNRSLEEIEQLFMTEAYRARRESQRQYNVQSAAYRSDIHDDSPPIM